MRQVAKKGLITAVATGGVLAITGGCAYADAGAVGSTAGSPGVLSGNTVQVPVHVPVNLCGNTVDVIGLLNPASGSACANTSAAAPAVGGGAMAAGSSTGSPGVLSGNTAQLPIDVPVNACGNSVNVIGALNPVSGSGCANTSATAPTAGGGAAATGSSTGSPGVGSGNTVQVPVHVPVNVCGNTVGVVGLLNPVSGSACGNVAVPSQPTAHTPATPPTRATPPRHRAPSPRGHQPRHARSSQPAPSLAYTGAGDVGMLGGAGAAALIGGFVLYRRGRALRG